MDDEQTKRFLDATHREPENNDLVHELYYGLRFYDGSYLDCNTVPFGRVCDTNLKR